ncbi:hypothetical protein NC652_012831 [Populus alba x Populus x berolinensis]|nr:hypothetical protein NC652_012831 [Populus alba x Populus x berolinensis]
MQPTAVVNQLKPAPKIQKKAQNPELLDPNNPAELRIISRRADAMKMPLESSIDRIKLNSTNEDERAVSLRPEEKEAREDQTCDLGYLKKPKFALTGKKLRTEVL